MIESDIKEDKSASDLLRIWFGNTTGGYLKGLGSILPKVWFPARFAPIRWA